MSHSCSVLLGFVINPIAGMGGSVALKGTDGDAYRAALSKGAMPLARGRAVRALSHLDGDIGFLTASGEMGAWALNELGFAHEVVWETSGESVPEDTRQACRRFLERKADLIVFCGGDGTARDVLDAVGDKVPVIGIPSGVKMHSASVRQHPRGGGRRRDALCEGRPDDSAGRGHGRRRGRVPTGRASSSIVRIREGP